MLKMVFLFILPLLLVLNLNSNENNISSGIDGDEIEIEQKSSIKYFYYKDDMPLTTFEGIKSAIIDIPEAFKMYEKALNKYIGFSVLTGFGMGISFPTWLSLTIVVPFTFNYGPIYGIVSAVLGTISITSTIMWIVGAINRIKSRLKMHEAIVYYNKKKKEKVKVNFIPDIYFDENLIPISKICFSIKF